jgi:hypothetical protein
MKVRLKFGMSFFLRFAGQPPAPAPPLARGSAVTEPTRPSRREPTPRMPQFLLIPSLLRVFPPPQGGGISVTSTPPASPSRGASARRRHFHPPCPLCAPSSPSALARHLPNCAPSASEWSHRQGNAAPSGRCRRCSSFPAVHVLRRHPWMSPPSPPVGRGCHRHLLPLAVDGSSRGRRYRHLLRTPLRSMDASTT